MKVAFQTVDVFTDRRFGGNPLAVIPDARGLTSEQMQAIAAEFNLAETTFVLPPQDSANHAQVRIFTPRSELPFAGHPNVGTAYVLARDGHILGRRIDGNRLLFEELAGLVSMELLKRDGAILGARLKAPQQLSVGEDIPIEEAAEAIGLQPDEIKITSHRPCYASCGAALAFVELKSRAALKAAAANAGAIARYFPMSRAIGVHLYVHTGDDGVDIQTRMFAPLNGIPEDPATGGANVALVGLIAGSEKKNGLKLRIGQGVDMGRPSLLEAEAVRAVASYDCFIGGGCVAVMSGEIEL